ncbi:MAG TPA: hypothetical protein VG387_20625 [Rhizomicrobium sp.]|jgi:hypothetical protein|nr:hypothetical protein [Rhizomicrobium sp.]
MNTVKTATVIDFNDRKIDVILSGLVGDRMYAITFILDYVQLQFDDHGLNAYVAMSVRDRQATYTAGAPGYRDALCACIGHPVSSVNRSDEALVVGFANGTITLSLLDPEFDGPETAQFFAPEGELIFRTGDICFAPR